MDVEEGILDGNGIDNEFRHVGIANESHLGRTVQVCIEVLELHALYA